MDRSGRFCGSRHIPGCGQIDNVSVPAKSLLSQCKPGPGCAIGSAAYVRCSPPGRAVKEHLLSLISVSGPQEPGTIHIRLLCPLSCLSQQRPAERWSVLSPFCAGIELCEASGTSLHIHATCQHPWSLDSRRSGQPPLDSWCHHSCVVCGDVCTITRLPLLRVAFLRSFLMGEANWKQGGLSERYSAGADLSALVSGRLMHVINFW
jgi:hypothetical protein